MGGRVTPITEAEKQRIQELHAQGLSRRAIAEELGRSLGGVSNVAKELGITFAGREMTKGAVAARQVDLRARRVQLMQDLIDDADRLRREVFGHYVLHGFGGGRELQHVAVDLPLPPAREQRDLMTAMSTAITAALKLDARDAGGSEQAKSVLGALAQGLGLAYDQLTAEADPRGEG